MMEGGGELKFVERVKKTGDKLHKKWGKGLKIASFWGYTFKNCRIAQYIPLSNYH